MLLVTGIIRKEKLLNSYKTASLTPDYFGIYERNFFSSWTRQDRWLLAGNVKRTIIKKI